MARSKGKEPLHQPQPQSSPASEADRYEGVVTDRKDVLRDESSQMKRGVRKRAVNRLHVVLWSI